jgi:hypothetical protein
MVCSPDGIRTRATALREPSHGARLLLVTVENPYFTGFPARVIVGWRWLDLNVMLPICCPRVIHNRLQPRCAPYAVVSLWSFVSAAQVEARDQTQRGRRCAHRRILSDGRRTPAGAPRCAARSTMADGSGARVSIPAGISSASFRTAREVVMTLAAVERSRCGIIRPPQSGSMNVESRHAGCW